MLDFTERLLKYLKHKNSFNKKQENLKMNKIWTTVFHNRKYRTLTSTNQSGASSSEATASQMERTLPEGDQPWPSLTTWQGINTRSS